MLYKLFLISAFLVEKIPLVLFLHLYRGENDYNLKARTGLKYLLPLKKNVLVKP